MNLSETPWGTPCRAGSSLDSERGEPIDSFERLPELPDDWEPQSTEEGVPMTEPSSWTPFYFESNMFFGTVASSADWERLRDAYPRLTNDELLAAKEATYRGSRSQEERDARPNYGFRIEHDGDRTLRDFFASHGMQVPNA